VAVIGEADPRSGYLLNIKTIDEAVRELVLPVVREACAGGAGADPLRMVRAAVEALRGGLPVRLRSVALDLSPYHSVEMDAADTTIAVLRIRFDFSASHRLHVAGWSEERNRECFGKCNHASGHGHNYQLEPAVEAPLGGAGVDVPALERVVHERVLERFDHKHLNVDTEEFADGSGLNPSVENIARVCYELLAGPVAALGPGVRLRSVRVWETDRTSSEYPV
jgi:6-pyruvoyltetrahydropterin/6-carboxytetrahydropterin synthase